MVKGVLLILAAFTLLSGCETADPGAWLQIRDPRPRIIGWV